jgi:hypothetical protein
MSNARTTHWTGLQSGESQDTPADSQSEKQIQKMILPRYNEPLTEPQVEYFFSKKAPSPRRCYRLTQLSLEYFVL